jgi:hypothetical protein
MFSLEEKCGPRDHDKDELLETWLDLRSEDDDEITE